MSSRSVDKRGYVQAEIRQAIDVLDQHPPSVPYLIPVRLDACKPTHERLSTVQWVDLFPKWRPGFLKLLRRLAPDESATPRTAAAARPRLRTDGVYVANTQGPYPYHYLKFLRGNIVVGCPSHWRTAQIAPWLTAYNKDIAAGTYSARMAKGRTTVAFQSASPEGVVEYRGYLLPADLLVVRKHSHITGYRDIEEYRFESLGARLRSAQPPKKLRDLWPVSRMSSRDGIAWTANKRMEPTRSGSRKRAAHS